MDNRTLADLLAKAPPVSLMLLELAAELTGPDGELDLDAVASRQHEVEMACDEAQAYAASSSRLAAALSCRVNPRRG